MNSGIAEWNEGMGRTNEKIVAIYEYKETTNLITRLGEGEGYIAV